MKSNLLEVDFQIDGERVAEKGAKRVELGISSVFVIVNKRETLVRTI